MNTEQPNSPLVPTKTFFQQYKIALVVLSVIAVAAVIIIVLSLSSKPKDTAVNQTTSSTRTTSQSSSQSSSTAANNNVRWSTDQNWNWMAMGTPPECPDPLVLTTPVDLAEVTSMLYPGQTRGEYKPHGGFRFDNKKDNKVTVVAPLDAVVVAGTRVLVNGEVQYGFDFENSCGIRYRIGHLLTLTPKMQAIADKFPAAVENDSRFNNVNPPVAISAGEELASEIGITVGGINTFLDFGVYDLRQKNEASQDAAWAASHPGELASNAVCWFDWLSSSDKATVRSLPATAGAKQSDYCK